jgi:hypothetical protein
VMINDLFHFSSPPQVLIMEKRNLSKKPIFNIKNLDSYPAAYTRFYDDRFPFRTKLIEYYSLEVCMEFFHRSPYPEKVTLGKDGWMFHAIERPFYDGTLPLNDEQVSLIVAEIHKRAVYYHDKGIRFYLAIPPMKTDIYPEYLPGNYYKVKTITATEKIIEIVSRDSLIKFIDLKSALIKAKKYGPLFYKTDNHWNTRGGYYAYHAILDRMKQDFSALQPLDTSDFKMNIQEIKGKNLTELIHLKDYFKDEEPTPNLKVERAKPGKIKGYKPRPDFPYPLEFEIVREVEDTSLPKILIVRDSFFYGLMPYIIENFKKTIIFYDSRVYGIFDDAVQIEKPDLVLYMIFEPRLPNLIGIDLD